MSKLVLSLPLHPLPEALLSFVRLNDAGRPEEEGAAPADQVPDADTWTGVIPLERLSWHRIELPRVNAASRLAALRATVEEWVLQDVDTLHLACFPIAPTRMGMAGAYWVAVCDQSWLEQVLQPLRRRYGRKRFALVPEMAPLNEEETAHAWVRAHAGDGGGTAWLGFATQEGVLGMPLEMWRGGADFLKNRPLQLWARTEYLADAELVLQTQGEPMEQGLFLARAALQGRDWNLAQFSFASHAGLQSWAKEGLGIKSFLFSAQWGLARWGVLAGLFCLVVGLQILTMQMRQQLQAKHDAMQQVLQQTFPHVQVVIDAPAQMQKEWERLQGADHRVDETETRPQAPAVWHMLQALQNEGLVTVAQGITYDGRRLFLQGVRLGPSIIQSLQAKSLYAGNEEGGSWVSMKEGP